ncbi:MAG: D-alanyl-D-alanine carboxypeptidase, partial [Clostridia bacterium]|nr:D-alanyl-D-alanine carboxypeptidase [Clostridia bacterium]
MAKVNKIRFLTIISLVLSFFLFKINTVSAYSVSQAECVIELNSLRVLSQNNKDIKLPMASTTKILTALTVIENFDINKTVEVKKSMTNIEGSSIYLKEGEHLTVKELLYGLMLRSGNDTAECLAQSLVCRDNFIKLMNETAKKYGAVNSNFTNPHGLHDENHYTTAYDLALITAGAMKNPVFKEIVSTKRINISNETENYDRVLINKNKMLTFYEGRNGVKTGYTKKAGRCLVSSAERNGM